MIDDGDDDWRRRVRPSDPFTSHMAAHDVDAAAWRERVWKQVISYGENGCTDAELIRDLKPRSESSCRSRVSELEELGLVYRSRWETRPSVKTGNPMTVIRAIEFVLWDGTKI